MVSLHTYVITLIFTLKILSLSLSLSLSLYIYIYIYVYVCMYVSLTISNSFLILSTMLFPALQLKRFLMRSGVGRKKKEATMAKKPSWMMPAVSHGYHTVESNTSPATYGDSDSDFVVAQREQIEELELWFFGVFDGRVGDGVTKYMQSHLFDKKPGEVKPYICREHFLLIKHKLK